MNIADELQKLEALHRNGTLGDEDFAQAKAKLLSENASPAAPARPPPPAAREGRCWGGLVFLVALGLVAWASNPDRDSLEKEWNARFSDALKKADVGLLETAAAKVLIETSVERKNYFFFSIGEVQAGVRLGDHKTKGYAFGAFGYWWGLPD